MILLPKETLPKLLFYFEELFLSMNRIYPEKITWENVFNYNYDLNISHPKWVKSYFPLILIYHKEKAGPLRKSNNVEIMYQNNFNVITQLVWTADDFGIYNRKNKHKGFNNIIAAISADFEDRVEKYNDTQKPIKYKNFDDLNNRYGKNNPYIKIVCEELSKKYFCDSTGQLKLI